MRRPLTLLLLTLGTAHAGDLEDVQAALKQARTQVARGQAEVTVLFPPRATPTRAAAQLPALTVRPALLARNFSVTRTGTEQVAGRDAARFTLTPKVGDAARWTLWVDLKWNVPLAFEERGADGTLARRAALTRVQPAPARATRPAPPRTFGRSAQPPTRSPRATRSLRRGHRWRPSTRPSGCRGDSPARSSGSLPSLWPGPSSSRASSP